MWNGKYTFEKSKIIYGDCLEKMKLIPDGSIDYVCSDLPYGKTKNKWDIIIPPELLWPEVWRVAKPNAAIKFFGQDKFTAMMMLSTKWHRYNLIWEKTTVTGHLNAKRQPMRCHEDMMLFYKKQPTYNPQKTTGHIRKVSTSIHKRDSKKTTNYGDHGLTSYDSTERYPRSVWKIKTDKQKLALHPTQKPVKLIEESILTYSNEGETILDLCSGSGTLAEACINTNRDFIIIEKNPNDFEIGKNRIGKIFENYKLDLQPLLIQ
jgi:site-specific DNA-methyltransferase (adenine-specific)